MKKTSHFIWTLGLSLFTFYYIFNENIIFTILYSLLTAFLSFLPDIDIRIIKKLKEFNKSTFYIFYIFTIPLHFLFKHRTWTHAIYIPAILFYLSEFIVLNDFQIILRILYLTLFFHILEDSFTIAGVKLLYPIDLKLRLGWFHTNKITDYIILNLIGFSVIFLFFAKLYF